MNGAYCADGVMIGESERRINRAEILRRRAQVLQSLYGGRQVAQRVVTSETVDGNQQHGWVLVIVPVKSKKSTL